MARFTDKQKMFIDEYLIDLNATQSAIRAGYSPKTAHQIAHDMMGKPHIAEEIARRKAERSRRLGINQERVVEELAKIAFSRLTDIVDPSTGEIREDATEDDLACLESVKIKTIPTKSGQGVEREIKMTQKIKAIELLGKHLGMFSDKLKIEGSLPVVIAGEDDLED